ncbi:MAG: ATP-binding cassette domain-containing protein [Deltaproteobacteria bacterium]|nr:ATP-binding cassette domain-containing protein [Deltaproteobacteria bacterium]
MLEVQNLIVFFENAIAVNDVSLYVKEGEIVGVLGSNSAGKTTLMNAISGLILDIKLKEERRGGERITILGDIIFQGKSIINLEPHKRVELGIVLSRERHPIFPESSAEENLKIAASSKARKDIKTDLDLVYRIFPHLKDIRKRRAGFLSGGEQQMLSIGMALMTRPKLLLLDEPLLGLAPVLQRDLVRAIEDIRKEGVTVLITEQFARPILPVIDRGYVIENGMLVIEGKGCELMENPEVRLAYFGI